MLRIVSPEQIKRLTPVHLDSGDALVSINGNAVNDLIDFRFHAAEDHLTLLIRKADGREVEIEYHTTLHGPLRLEFEPDPIRRCHNKCVFCFVHQLPKGLRRALYIKDEDYRESFMHGSYITLTNLTEADFRRIMRMRLSPLFISVHSTDESVRQRLLGRADIPPLMPQLKRLVKRGIELHTQIVVCPGINDGDELVRSAQDLARLHPGVKSLAVVPVGLSRHRVHLPKLRQVTGRAALELLAFCDDLQARFRKELGSRFVYPSDELLLLAGRPIPGRAYYEEFPQVENGVGMVRQLMSSRRLPSIKLKRLVRFAVVTGLLAGGFLPEVLEEKLRAVQRLEWSVIPVTNRLLGKSVTVSGLLPGRDIHTTLRRRQSPFDLVFLPPNCLNHDRLFIDDWTPQDLQRKLDRPVVTSCYSVYNTFMPVLRRML